MKDAIRWMAQNHVAANLIMMVFIVGGLILGFSIKQEVFPEVALDRVSVSVAYPGAGPEEVEEGVILKIEENLTAFKTIMGDVLDKGFKDALKENKLGKRIPKLTKSFNQLLPKAREHYKGELAKVNDDLLKRTSCQ